MLESGKAPSKDTLVFIADLLNRYQLKRKRGAQAMPAYRRSDAEVALLYALDEVRELLGSGKGTQAVFDAVEKVSDARGIPFEILEGA